MIQGSSFTVKCALSLRNSSVLCKSLGSFIMIFSAKDVSSYSLLARYYNILLELVEVGTFFFFFIFSSKNEILLLFYETLNVSDTKKIELKQIVTQFLPQYEILFAL